MVKKIMKAWMVVLTVTILFSVAVFATEEDRQNEEESTVTDSPEYIIDPVEEADNVAENSEYIVDPVIDVELPGNLNFAINPLSLDADGDGTEDAQIISGEYLITNNSNVPVVVEAITMLSGGDKIDVLPDAVYDEKSGDLKASADGKKAIWMVQLLPTAPANLGEGEILTVTPPGSMDNNPSIKGKVIGSTDETAAKVLFLLDANTAETMSPGCVSGFKFAGAVDPAQVFDQADAVKVTSVFTLNILDPDEAAQNYIQEDGYDKTIVKAR